MFTVAFHDGWSGTHVCDAVTLAGAKRKAKKRWPEITGWDGPMETGWVGYSQSSWVATGIGAPCEVSIDAPPT